MARTISDEQIKLSVIIDGNPAQKELHDVEKSIRDLNKQQTELRKEKQLLEKAGQKESARYREVTQAMRENTAAINANKSRMEELQKEIGITGLTMAQLRSKATALRATLNNLVPGSADYQRLDAELRQVNARMSELRGNATAAGFSIGRLADGFNRYAALGASVIATATGVVFSIQKILDISGKLSDAQSDVQKTTGMTKEEVDDLTKSFGLLQTRTQRIDLLKIAEQGGRIGIAKDEIQDFVRVMDKASVALGDSFSGGAEQVSDELGKIKFLFKETKDVGVENAYLAIGSAINVLGAEGSASEANIANFTKRIGSLPDVIKPTVAETMALGAAFEESGIEAEVSARAYSIFLKQASTETAKFAQVMGISQEQVEKMINDDPLEFFLKFSKQLSESAKKGTDMSKVLDQLGLNADGVNKIVGSAGNNVDRFRQLIEFSNTAFNEGTSLIEEYDIKNNNLAATIEKVQKRIQGIFTSETVVEWITNVFNWLAKFIGATEDASGKVEGFRNKLIFFLKVLTVLIASYISYNLALRLTTALTKSITIAQSLYNAVQQRGTIVTGLLKGAQLLLAAAYNLVTGNINRAAAAMRMFNTVTKLNPLGLLLGLITAVGLAMVAFSNKNKEASKSVQDLSTQLKLQNAIQKQFEKDFSESSQKLKSKIEPLISILKDQNLSLHTRKKAYEELIKIAPEFRGTVDKEYKATAKLDEVYRNLLQSMAEKMRFQAMQKVMQKNYDDEAKAIAKIIDLETKKKELDKAQDDFQKSRRDNRKNVSIFMEQKEINEKLAEAYEEQNLAQKNQNQILAYRKRQITELENEQKKYNEGSKDWLRIQEKINALLGVTTPNKKIMSTDSTSEIDLSGGTGGKDKSPKEKKYDDSYLDEEKRRADELIKLQEQNELDRLNMLEDSYGKEIALEKTKHRSKIEELNRQNEAYNMMLNDLDMQYLEAQKNGDVKKMDSIKRSQLYITDLIQENNETIQISQETHLLKIATIQEKWAKDEISKAKEKYDLEKTQRETAFLEELNSLDLSEKEKQKRKDQFNKQEIEKEEEFLKSLIAKLNDITKGTKTESVDVNLLSPEQVEYFTQEAAKLGLTLQELIDKKNKLAGKGTDFDILSGVGTDIFGFSPEQWEDTFSKLQTTEEQLKSIETVFGGLQNAWGSFSAFLDANDKRELRNIDKNTAAKKRKLKQDLDNGIINKVQYNKAIEKLDQDKEKKIAEIEYKKAKRDRIASLATIAIQTAIGISKSIAASPLTAGMPWTAIIAGIGALQAATVLATPLPAKGYEQGLYPEDVVREQDGRKFKAGYGGRTRSGMVTKPTYFLAGENYKPEMVIDNKAYRDLSPYTRNLLINELRGIKGFENGYYNPQAMRIEVPATPTPAVSNIPNDFLVSLIAENTEVMKELRDLKENGVIAYISKDLKEMKKLQEQLDKYKNLKRNNQV